MGLLNQEEYVGSDFYPGRLLPCTHWIWIGVGKRFKHWKWSWIRCSSVLNTMPGSFLQERLLVMIPF